MLNSTIGRTALAIALLAIPASRAMAGPIVFTGTDIGVGPGSATPNATAASTSFNAAAAAIGKLGLITFESAQLGAFSSLTVAPGVTLTGADQNGNKQQILNTPNFPSNPALDGFNTTPGGSQYAEMTGGTLTFTFATPTQFFGAFITGVQSTFFNDVLTFSDGTSQTVPITNSNPTAGGVTFIGFTDAGKSVSSVTIFTGPQSGADYVGVDDVSYQSVQTIPEPASITLCLTSALLGLGYARRGRLKKA